MKFPSLSQTLQPALERLDALTREPRQGPIKGELGRVLSVDEGVATIVGLPNIGLDELVCFEGGELGLAMTLHRDEVGVVLLDDARNLRAGGRVRRLGAVLDVPVGESLLGRVVDPLGRARDGLPQPQTHQRRAAESPAPEIMERAPVERPLQTGIKVIDALVPIGRGQRELIVGDRQTGKTSIALDTIINQADKGVVCIYCSIGQRDSGVTRVLADLKRHQAMEYTCLVVAASEDSAGMQYVAPYAATAVAEYFMHRGQDVLVVYDDLTRHARAYREMSLLLRRPPGREAFPGDIFYVHSRLLERSTHLRQELGGGSLTALPIVETEAQNLAAYIPTNLISITDGQIVTSPNLFQKGLLPAIDVGRSVSRVGGDAQLRAYRAVTGELRLDYAQFEELESFARFDTRLSEATLKTLERGRRVREILRQPRYRPLPVLTQVAVMLAATEGLLDAIPIQQILSAEFELHNLLEQQAADIAKRIQEGDELSLSDRKKLRGLIKEVLKNGDA